MPEIKLEHVTKRWGKFYAVEDLDLTIEDNAFVTLLGPSGCGKTTTLRIIGGFLTPTSGTVTFDGKTINDVPPYKRQINTVFQRYALFPHLDVYDNVAFGLKVNKVPKAEIDQRVRQMLEIVSLKGYENRRIDALSGGQQQRVLLARALCATQKMLLLDEPVSGLDPKVTAEMYALIQKLNYEDGITVVMISHDLNAALQYASHILHIGDRVFFGTKAAYLNEFSQAWQKGGAAQ